MKPSSSFETINKNTVSQMGQEKMTQITKIMNEREDITTIPIGVRNIVSEQYEQILGFR